MRKWHFAAAVLSVAAIPALSAGCEPEPLGELVLIVKTDMAPPKDFNKMQIQVFNEGALKFKFEGPVPGDPGEEARIVLPSTLGLVAPEDPSNSIRIEVGVRSGGKEGPVRVVREVVTTIPADRVAMLHIPIQFLCKKDDIPFDNNGDLKPSDCPDGKTCIAGRCEDSVVESAKLPDFNADEVFGGSGDPAKGKCFDVAKCFDEAELIDGTTLDTGECTFPIPDAIEAAQLNLALGVESDGICNGRGCFVVLDANSDTGWKLSENAKNVVLPKGVCDNLTSDSPSGLKVLQIVQANTNADCPQKDVSYPTCGPWSAVESAPPEFPVPTAIAGAQDHPISVTLFDTADGAFAYWTSSGSSSIKGASVNGGPLISIDSAEPPRDVVATEKALFWTAAGADGVGSVYSYLAQPQSGQDALVKLNTDPLAQPDGIAFASDPQLGDKVFWTEFANPGRVFAGTLNGAFSAFADVKELDVDNPYPARIVADKSYIYWTNEGTFDEKSGTVARLEHASAMPIKLNLTLDPMAAPRALALDLGPGGLATDLYFATIADGTVWRIRNASAESPDAPEVFAMGLSAPNGIAIDANNVYIANRGAGTIVYKPKSAAADEKPLVIASGQKNPGTIVIENGTLLWVNEGPSAKDTQEGSIIKLDTSGL